MKFEDYFSFEAIVRDLVKWRIAGKDVDGTLPPRKMWSRAGVKERKGVDPAVVRKQSILRTVMRYRNAKSRLPPHLCKSGGNRECFFPPGNLGDTTWEWTYKNESGQVFVGTLLHTKGDDIAAKLAPPKQ